MCQQIPFTPQWIDPRFDQPRHCAGCRCFTTTTTIQPTLIPPYKPKHRKPGPAR